jgi:hypothetical protein
VSRRKGGNARCAKRTETKKWVWSSCVIDKRSGLEQKTSSYIISSTPHVSDPSIDDGATVETLVGLLPGSRIRWACFKAKRQQRKWASIAGRDRSTSLGVSSCLFRPEMFGHKVPKEVVRDRARWDDVSCNRPCQHQLSLACKARGYTGHE